MSSLHKKQHRTDFYDPRSFDNELMFTNDEDLHYIRNPFPDLVRAMQLNPQEGDKLLDDLNVKLSYLPGLTNILRDNKSTKEAKAYTRYADFHPDQDPQDYENTKHLFYSPRGEAYRRINPAELYRVPKTENHTDDLRRSKAFLADKFFGPFELQESNLRHLFYDKKAIYQSASSEADPQYIEWRS